MFGAFKKDFVVLTFVDRYEATAAFAFRFLVLVEKFPCTKA